MGGRDDGNAPTADEVLNPPTRSVRFRNELLQVQPLRLEQLGPFIGASRTVIARIALLAGVLDSAKDVEAGAIVLDLLEQDGNEIAAALGVAVDREPKWVSGGTLDEVAQLLEAVAGLNKDFFARRLRTMVVAVREAVAFPTPPNSSST